MSLLFGGGGQKAKPQFTGLAIQTSSTTMAITQSWGYGRQAPNIIWQDDFKSHKKKQKAGKGLGGSQTTYTYSASFILAMGWGPFSGCDRVWKDQSKETSFTKLGFSLFTGTIPQAPWGYLVSAHPAEALGYPGIGYFAVANYDLGQSNSIAQHSFLMRRPLYNTAPGGTGDADVALVIDDFLTNEENGVLIGDDVIDTNSLLSTVDASTTGDNTFQTYCTAMGFGMSPELESQETASEILLRWTDLFNTALVWTGYSLKFLPYGTDEITANGVTYKPDFVVRYQIDDTTLLYQEGEDPIQLRRKSPQDGYNSLSLEIKSRSNEYNTEPAPWSDQGLIDQFGPRPMGSVTAHEIKEQSIGLTCAALMGQRKGYIRNEWDAQLPPSYALLEPGDIVEFYDPEWGWFTTMVISIEENDDDTFSLIVEEWNDSVSSAGTTQSGTVTNNPINTGVEASDVNPPIIFQPPPTLTNGQPEVWAAVSGGDGSVADPIWGGCEVWLSTDGGTSYNMVGVIEAPARMGKLTAGLAAYGGSNPDTANTLKVDSAMSEAEFSDATAADAAAAVTLFYIEAEGANTEEYGSYTDATLNAPDEYWFDDLYRGLHGTAPGAHGIGAPFARLDNESIFKYGFPLDLIGETIYVKFVSFNIWSAGYQDIATVTAYPFTISSAYTYGTGVEDLNDVEVTSPPNDGDTLVWDTDHWEPGIPNIGPQPFGFGFNRDTSSANINRPITAFDTPIAWTMPVGLPDCQGTITDGPVSLATAPSAQTDFDIQVAGVSVGTMRFAASSLTATFIKASPTSVALGALTTIVAPANLNGMAGIITGSIKGTRP